jgi:hypothetical protein
MDNMVCVRAYHGVWALAVSHALMGWPQFRHEAASKNLPQVFSCRLQETRPLLVL